VKDDQGNLLLYPTLSETGMRLGISVRNAIYWFRPGFFRAARIFSITTGRPVTNDNASDERRTYPPPSPWEPSMVRIPDAIVPLL
jgi:hypothetical protein